jgi:hypothetical protein
VLVVEEIAHSKKLAGSDDSEHGFLALAAHNGEYDPAAENVEHVGARIALPQYDLVAVKRPGSSFAGYFGEECFQTKPSLSALSSQ